MRQQHQQSEVLNNFRKSAYELMRYASDAKVSFIHPLPRREIDLGYRKLEVFALPSYQKEPDRYLLSQTGVAQAIGEDEISARRYFRAINPEQFRVEGSKRPIRGIKLETALEYWFDQATKGNKKARNILRALTISGLEHYADLQFNIKRSKEEQQDRLIQLIDNTSN